MNHPTRSAEANAQRLLDSIFALDVVALTIRYILTKTNRAVRPLVVVRLRVVERVCVEQSRR